jgi:hypothetical protein
MTVATAGAIPRTCYEIITDAMTDAGYLGMGAEPNSEQIAVNMRRLNNIINYIQVKYGLKLFLQEDFPLTITAGVSLYTLGPAGTVVMNKPRRCIEAYYTDVNLVRRPLIMISRQEWDSYATVTTPGTVTAVFVDKQQLTLNINLWMTPSAQMATGIVHLILDQQAPNFVSVTEQMAFPPEWALTLQWQLADQISSGQPMKIIELCKGNAEKYLSELEDWDVEDASTNFWPDSRGLFVGRRFS